MSGSDDAILHGQTSQQLTHGMHPFHCMTCSSSLAVVSWLCHAHLAVPLRLMFDFLRFCNSMYTRKEETCSNIRLECASLGAEGHSGWRPDTHTAKNRSGGNSSIPDPTSFFFFQFRQFTLWNLSTVRIVVIILTFMSYCFHFLCSVVVDGFVC